MAAMFENYLLKLYLLKSLMVFRMLFFPQLLPFLLHLLVF